MRLAKKEKKQSELFISDGITTINTEAFSNCGALKKITIPRTVINIGSDIFRGCRWLKSDGVINNLGVLFDWWVNHHIYKDKTLNQITKIDLSQFKNSEGKPFTIINDYAFNSADNLAKILINDEVKSIKKGAFRYCSSLKEVMLPKHLQTIGAKAFESCELLEEIKIPQTVNKIDQYAFAFCYALKQVSFANGINLTVIADDTFASCIGLTQIKLPHTVKTIGASAFSGCYHLKEVVIPNVTTIEAFAFYECGPETKYYVGNVNIKMMLVNLKCWINENQIIVTNKPIN